jgi:hypothetical protein
MRNDSGNRIVMFVSHPVYLLTFANMEWVVFDKVFISLILKKVVINGFDLN